MNQATLVKTYWSDDRTKRAEIHKDPEDGLSVRLFSNDGLTETHNLNNYSIRYAEDYAEDYVLGDIVRQPKTQLNG